MCIPADPAFPSRCFRRDKMSVATAPSGSAVFNNRIALEIRGDVAQLGERLPCTQEVDGSSPFISTISFRRSCTTPARRSPMLLLERRQTGGDMEDPLINLADDLIAEDVREFIRENVDSFITWELMVFLHSNPEFMGNILDLAAALGRDEKDVLKAVLFNVEQRFLVAEHKAGEPFYWFTNDPELRSCIARAVEAAQDSNVRLRVIAHILSKSSSR